jgi:antitoxin VapB
MKSVAFKKSCGTVVSRARKPNAPLAIVGTLAYVYGICLEIAMAEQRHVRLFRNGRNQAVRIPVEFELPGDEAIMHRDGDRLVIAPVRKRGLIALLKTMQPLDEDFPEIADPAPPPERVL